MWRGPAILVILLAACDSNGTTTSHQFLLPDGTRILVEAFDHGRVLAPGEETDLTVKVVGPVGEPLEGISVLFVSPDRGASGDFPAGAQATSGTDGTVAVRFRAGTEEGVFLVDVAIAGTEITSTFAVTVTVSPGTALDPADARQWIEQLALDGTQGYLAVVHGPVLVAAGTIIEGGSQQLTVNTLSWFFWLDDLPGARFDHPATFFLVDATRPTADLGTTITLDVKRWPLVTLPGGTEPTNLLPPVQTNASAVLTGGVTPPAQRDVCAVVLGGPGGRAFMNDVAHVSNFFREIYGAKLVRDQKTPATFEDLARHFEKVREANCPKVFLYLSGHGGEEGPPTITLGSDGARNIPRDVKHSDIAALIAEIFAGTTTKFCIILDSCFSERARSAYGGRGLNGEVAVSSSATAFPWSRGGLGTFTRLLIECWTGPLPPTADTDGDIDLGEAVGWVNDQVDYLDFDRSVAWALQSEADARARPGPDVIDIFVRAQQPSIGTIIPTAFGLFGPIGQGVDLPAEAPLGFAGSLALRPVVFGAQNGAIMIDANDGTVTLTVDIEPAFGAAALSALNTGGFAPQLQQTTTRVDALFLYGPGGAFLTHYDPASDAFDAPVSIAAGSVTDGAPYGDDPTSRGLVFANNTHNEIGIVEFDIGTETYVLRRTLTSASWPGASGNVISAFRTDAGGPVFFVTDTGEVWMLADLDGQATRLPDPLGTAHRRIRAFGPWLFISAFGASGFDGGVTIFVEDGASYRFFINLIIQSGVIGIDVKALASGNVALVAAGWDPANYTLMVLDGAGTTILSFETFALPEGCVNAPGAVWLSDDPFGRIVVPCNFDGRVAVLPTDPKEE